MINYKDVEEKFSEGYLIDLTQEEKTEVITICDHLQALKFSKALPKAFTEKGLYMLATILKSPKATQTTLLIIDTFAKVRELGSVMYQVQDLPANSSEQLMPNASQNKYTSFPYCSRFH